MKKYILLLILLASLAPSALFAQNDVQQTNYMFNELSFNPAYAGATGTIRATLLARKQWIGFENSPFMQTLAVDGSMKRFGSLGFVAINDMLGYQHFVHAKALYSYTVKFTEKTCFTLGAGGGIIYSSLDGSSFEYQDKQTIDPVGIFDTQSDVRPTFDIGVQFLHSNLSLGLSVTHVQQSLRYATIADNPQHYYLYGQYKWNLNSKVYAVPTVWVKHGSNKTQADANVNFYINNRFWLGATYRIQESAAFLAGLILKEQWYVGYSYDFPVSNLTGHNLGNHEIFISFRLKPPTAQSGFYQSTRLFN